MREFLIDPKRDPEQEYTIHLFEFCNLSCSFCWQNHQDKIGLDTVLNKLEPIEKFISKENKNKVTLNLMGGEVFAPTIYTKELNDFIDEQTRRLVQSGITLNINDPKVKDLLETAYLSGDTDNQIDIKALALNKGKIIGGEVGGSIVELRAYASAFGIKYSDTDYSRFSEEIFSGKTTPKDIQSKIRQDSASMYPIYSEQILNGTSIATIGSAYKSSYATILELDPDSVDFSDPMLRKAVQYTLDGKPAVMPLWQWEQELRKDARWQYTDQARESTYNAIYQVKTDMGLL